MQKRRDLLVLGCLVAVLLVASFFRLWKLDSVPRGLSHDEANTGLMATEIIKGARPMYGEIYLGMEPGLIYPLAGTFRILGISPLSQRLLCVAFGLLSVVLVYLFAVRLVRSRLVGLLSALLAALSFWQVLTSRLGLRAVLMPSVEILTLLFFWKAMEGRRLRDFALAGILGGLALYTYVASRFLPFVPVVFVLYLLVRRENLRSAWTGLGLMVALWVVTFLPLGIYFLHNPHWFAFEAQKASVFAPGTSGGGRLALLRETVRTLGMFTFRGEASWRYNIPDRPIFDWIIGLFFYAGVAISVVRSLRRPKLNPWAYALIIPLVMLVPSFVTVGNPHFLRALGTVPTVFLFPAIAMQQLVLLIPQRRRWVLAALLAVWAVYAGWSTYHGLFQVWARSPEAREVYNASLAEISDYLKQNEESGPLLIASSNPSNDRESFNLVAHGEPPPVRWFNGTQALVFPESGVEPARYFLPATVKMAGALRSLLPADSEQFLAPGGSLSFELIRTLAQAPVPKHHLVVALGDQVQLLGYDTMTSTAQAGKPLDLRLYWRVLTNPDPRRAWTWFVHLVDRRGVKWATWSGQGLEVADWRPGDTVIQDVSLDVLFDLPDLDYHLEMGMFDRRSGERMLDSNGMDHVAVPGVRIRPADPASLVAIIDQLATSQLGEDLRYLGSQLSAEKVAPGAEVMLSQAWSPRAGLGQDQTFRLQLIAAGGTDLHEITWAPLGGEYPTSQWPVGGIVRDVLVFKIPGDMQPGKVSLVVSADGLSGSVQAGTLEIVP